jgi:PAS domain S-box-containing protein
MENSMPTSDIDREKTRQEEHLRVRQQIAFASGLFQGDVTIRTLLESIAEGVVIIDKFGTILLVNAYAAHMFGYPVEELIGAPHAVLIPERFQEIHKEHQAHFFAEPKIRPMGQLLALSGRRQDGNEFPVEICLSFIETINGILVLAFVSDITERRRAEDEIVRLNAELTVRAGELEIANRELEAFNYTVAHDLRQPLNVLSICHQAIDMMCREQLKEECQEYFQRTRDVTFQMNSIIDALLNFSRLGYVSLQREKVNLSALAHRVAAALKLTDSERQVDFQIAEEVETNADVNLVEAVLNNLLGNAWKFSAQEDRGVIEFGAVEISGQPVYFVRDNGVGFDMEEADRLFTPFQRLSGAEECKGFGIGLATVGRIIHRHGGRVWAKSERGKGATFYFTLSAG